MCEWGGRVEGKGEGEDKHWLSGFVKSPPRHLFVLSFARATQ